MCQFEDVQSAVDTSVQVLQTCISVAKIGKRAEFVSQNLSGFLIKHPNFHSFLLDPQARAPLFSRHRCIVERINSLQLKFTGNCKTNSALRFIAIAILN